MLKRTTALLLVFYMLSACAMAAYPNSNIALPAKEPSENAGKSGTYRCVTSNPNYFFPSYQSPGDVYSLPRSRRHRERWVEAAEVASPYAAKVLNLSPTSRIEAFPQSTVFQVHDHILNEPEGARGEPGGPHEPRRGH